jgi:predicted Fe-Mo cluster-binding NifX family protein
MDAGERLALTSVAVNFLVTGLKYFLGVFSGSLALLADAVHSSADLVSSAAIWAGLRISRRKTRRFPYGLYVDRILLHYEPVRKETQVVAMPVSEDRLHLSEHFGEAPYFLVLTLRSRDNRLLEEKLISNPHRWVKTGKGIQVSEWLVGQGVDEVMAAKSFEHKGPHYVFADAGVTIQQTEKRDIDKIKAGLVALEKEAEAKKETQTG